jgi:hypothetical protein
MAAEFVRDNVNDPAKAETWTLVDGDLRLTLGWRKGARWIAVDLGEDTTLVQLTEAQMRQLGEIASRI